MWPERTQLPQKDVPPQNRYQLRRNGRPDRSTPASGRGYTSEYPGLRPQFRQGTYPEYPEHSRSRPAVSNTPSEHISHLQLQR